MQQVLQILGIVSGLLSLAGVIYLIGYWKGGIDAWKREMSRCIEQYPPAETALMVKTLWEIYVVDALRARPDLAEHASLFKLKKEAEFLIPDEIKQRLVQIPRNPENSDEVASGWLVVKKIGLYSIERLAVEKNLSVQETIAILSTYLDEHGRRADE